MKLCTKKSNTYFICTAVARLIDMKEKHAVRTIWFYQTHTTAEEIKMLLDCEPCDRPDFVIIAFSQLFSLFQGSAKADFEYFLKGGLDEDQVPSQRRKKYGLLMDRVTPKLLKKQCFKAILCDRPDYQIVPIDLKHLELLEIFGIKTCL